MKRRGYFSFQFLVSVLRCSLVLFCPTATHPGRLAPFCIRQNTHRAL
jgi:hypothetical protein